MTKARRVALLASVGAALIGIDAVFTAASRAVGFNPVYLTNTDAATGVTAEAQGIFASNEETSIGYFFDSTRNGAIVNALGFYALAGWSEAPSPAPYTVTLWAYTGITNPQAQFQQLASVVFDPSQLASYPIERQYYWIPIDPVNLGPETASDPARGFAVAAIGNFGPMEPGSSVPANQPALFAGPALDANGDPIPGAPQGSNFAVGSFAPGYVFDGNGFNTEGSPEYALFPLPLDYFSNPESANDPLTYYGFFNPNVSYQATPVPGPLPLIGLSAAYGWSRLLRRRCQRRL